MRLSKKICFISHGLAGGGMERSLVTLANHFINAGSDVTIINLYKTEIFFEIDSRINIVWPSFKRVNKAIYILRLLSYIRKEVHRIKPEVVLSFGETFNAYVIISTRLLDLRRLILSNRMWPSLKLGFPLDQANYLLYRYADGVIAQTTKAKELISEKSPNKNIVIIPNSVKPIDVELKIKKKQVVTVGRLSKAKGHIILIRAFALVSNLDWELHIIGDGPERKFLEDEAEKLKIGGRVIFHGHLKDFKHILAESSIFVLPSLFEGFPNALLEAMSVPLPCISSDCVAGPSDIIKHNINGFLFETEDFNSLAKIMCILIEDGELRLRISNEAFKIRDTYEFKKIGNFYLKFLLNE
jgi:glycosyltransferase involved in cell wall biosynthesis